MQEESKARRFSRYYEEGNGVRPTTHHRLVYQAKHEFDERGVVSFLDVGAGRGHILKTLNAHPSFFAEGTEIAPHVLAKDLKKFAVSPDETLELFDSGSFDMVLGVDLIECMDIEEAFAMIREMWRVARVGLLLTVGGECELHQWKFGEPFHDRIRREILAAEAGHPGTRGAGDIRRILYWKERVDP